MSHISELVISPSRRLVLATAGFSSSHSTAPAAGLHKIRQQPQLYPAMTSSDDDEHLLDLGSSALRRRLASSSSTALATTPFAPLGEHPSSNAPVVETVCVVSHHERLEYLFRHVPIATHIIDLKQAIMVAQSSQQQQQQHVNGQGATSGGSPRKGFLASAAGGGGGAHTADRSRSALPPLRCCVPEVRRMPTYASRGAPADDAPLAAGSVQAASSPASLASSAAIAAAGFLFDAPSEMLLRKDGRAVSDLLAKMPLEHVPASDTRAPASVNRQLPQLVALTTLRDVIRGDFAATASVDPSTGYENGRSLAMPSVVTFHLYPASARSAAPPVPLVTSSPAPPSAISEKTAPDPSLLSSPIVETADQRIREGGHQPQDTRHDIQRALEQLSIRLQTEQSLENDANAASSAVSGAAAARASMPHQAADSLMRGSSSNGRGSPSPAPAVVATCRLLLAEDDDDGDASDSEGQGGHGGGAVATLPAGHGASSAGRDAAGGPKSLSAASAVSSASSPSSATHHVKAASSSSNGGTTTAARRVVVQLDGSSDDDDD